LRTTDGDSPCDYLPAAFESLMHSPLSFLTAVLLQVTR
jgi:hypothetical protein